MHLKYLAVDDKGKEILKQYRASRVLKLITQVKNTDCLVVEFLFGGNNKKSAKVLSEIYEYFQGNPHVIIIENGCADYFNKHLYPMISDFERKLRTLLYLISSIQHEKNTTSVISDLESKDFGVLFTILFIDENFMRKTKEQIKMKNKEAFNKASIKKLIEEIEEETMWNRLLGENTIPTLEARFDDIRKYRNDVMHCQDFSYQKYLDIRNLYAKVNKELDVEIKKIYKNVSSIRGERNFNDILRQSIYKYMEEISMDTAEPPNFEYMSKYSGAGINEEVNRIIRESVKKLINRFSSQSDKGLDHGKENTSIINT